MSKYYYSVQKVCNVIHPIAVKLDSGLTACPDGQSFKCKGLIFIFESEVKVKGSFILIYYIL